MRACSKSAWPPRLVTVPGLHGSEGAHWQTWLERQFPRSLRVEQDDWDAPDLARWAQSVRVARPRTRPVRARRTQLRLPRGRACARAVAAYGRRRGRAARRARQSKKFTFAGPFDARRLPVPSIVIGSETDPWMPLGDARTLAQHLGSAFVNLGDAGHINTAAGFGPWPRAEVLHRHARPLRGTAALSRRGRRLRNRARRPRARARGLTGGRRGAHAARRLSRHRAPLHLRRTHGPDAGRSRIARPAGNRRGPRWRDAMPFEPPPTVTSCQRSLPTNARRSPRAGPTHFTW